MTKRLASPIETLPNYPRRLLIDLALARGRPGMGSGEAFMRGRTAIQHFPDLRGILAGIDWVVVEATATRAYMPERYTQDLDILIRAADEEWVAERLIAAGYERAAELGISGAAFTGSNDLEVGVLFGEAAWLEEGLARPNRDAAGLPVLDLPYLVLMKLAAGRVRDIGDVATMLGWADDEALTRVRDAVDRYSPADRADLESLIYLGRRERGKT
jgi:hypothetical protein